MRIKSITIDISGESLDNIGAILDETIQKQIFFIEQQGNIIHNVNVMPIKTNYTVPQENSYRDYHYTENGFICVITYESKA